MILLVTVTLLWCLVPHSTFVFKFTHCYFLPSFHSSILAYGYPLAFLFKHLILSLNMYYNKIRSIPKWPLKVNWISLPQQPTEFSCASHHPLQFYQYTLPSIVQCMMFHFLLVAAAWDKVSTYISQAAKEFSM